MILDEPTEGLDPNQRHDIASLIKNLSKKRTVIISSHVLSEIAKIANRLVIIHKGKIIADETPENLKKLGRQSQIVEMEVEGRNIISEIKKIKGVLKVNKIKNNYFEIRAVKNQDIRKDLFKTAVANRWLVSTLVAKEKAIEEVFSQLTHN